MLKSSKAIIENSVRFTMEADSLNSSVLGPDAAPGTEEFDLFVREVVREMTVKAGQKCTAIRRALAPRAFAPALAEAIGKKLAQTSVGHPGTEGVRMGPLASLSQREEVRERIAELAKDGEIVAGDPATAKVASGDAEKGAFLNPVLLYCDKPLAATRVHDVEAFGPVSTVLPYDSIDEAVEIARRGKGSLVASVFTNDGDAARELVLGLAPFHGRVMIGNRVSAKSSTGHGSPLPTLVHGGPGRAGGGEELGGMRAVKHYMQRTAIQGAPALLSAVTGRWIDGAPTRADKHPFRKSLAELKVGDQIVTKSREVTLDDIEHFAHFTGDTFYAHMDEAAAKANPFFDGRVAHGYLIVSFAAGLFVDPAPGPVLANYGVDNLRFLTPVYAGDSLQVRLTCKEINPRASAEHGEVRWDCRVTNQKGETVAQYDVLTMVAKEWPAV
jgi:oxepin-CoA hydrolase/3-oxo-5,6-dehydrosuberyl-CoA semialdehyde dehydrogenase